jgi:hypothetical protein
MKHNNQVDIPLVFFSLAFFIILFGLFSRFSFQQKKYIEPQNIKNTTSETPVKSQMIKLNYNNPLICNYQTKDASISASVVGVAISASMQKNKIIQRYVVEGDCIFSWVESEKIGKKQCGVGQYITIGKQLLGSGMASADSLSGMAKQMGKSIPFDMGSLLETCRNVKSVEKGVFEMPENVGFK